jgi:hypothetical protein
MHIYDYTNPDSPFLSEETSITSIRKNINLFPSVTTILKMIPNPFLDKWKCSKYVELARKYPEKCPQEISDLAWGQVRDPYGNMLSSSDFGTLAHKCLEDYINGDDMDEAWHEFVSKVIFEIDDLNLSDIKSEYLIADEQLRVAGTIDLLAKKDDRYVLLDYKFRNCKGTGKFYDSDCYQLSIESFFVQQKFNLTYLPKICSICVDVNTGLPYLKWWSQKKLDKGIQVFLDARDLYFTMNNLD